MTDAQSRPVPGEAWTMQVVVEREDPERVAYAVLDAASGLQSDQRELPHDTFMRMFLPHGYSYSLQVEILAVEDSEVTYQPLGVDLMPADGPVKTDLGSFLRDFQCSGRDAEGEDTRP